MTLFEPIPPPEDLRVILKPLDDPGVRLYHYTSGAGLTGILDGKCLWASNIHQLNDRSEFTHALELAKVEVNLRKSRFGEEITSRLIDVIDLFAEFSVHVVSFSEERDSLSQWLSYCPNSLGYCIGFTTDRLSQILIAQGFTLGKCVYDLGEQRLFASDWAEDSLIKLDKANAAGAQIDEINRLMHRYVEPLVLRAPFFKHPSFSHENEWRAVNLATTDSENIKLRPGKSMMIQYVEVPLGDLKVEPLIWDICVGPTPHPYLAAKSVSLYLNRINFGYGIRSSETSFRGW